MTHTDTDVEPVVPASRDWDRWFAWRPVVYHESQSRIVYGADGRRLRVWLRVVERMWTGSHWVHRKIDVGAWHDWFAWHPVYLDDEVGELPSRRAWLVRIQRRAVSDVPSDHGYDWGYRVGSRQAGRHRERGEAKDHHSDKKAARRLARRVRLETKRKPGETDARHQWRLSRHYWGALDAGGRCGTDWHAPHEEAARRFPRGAKLLDFG